MNAQRRKRKSWLDEMNRHYAVVRIGGKTRVMIEDFDPAFDRPVYHLASFEDIRQFHCNKSVAILNAKGEEQERPLGHAWLEHPRRREFLGVIFAPDGRVPKRYFNQWQGYGVVPHKGKCPLWRAHVHEVICAGDPRLFSYVFAWMAWTVQRPTQPIEVALVLRGKQGTGKGVFAREFGKIFGRHFIHISSIRHLTGNFNAHLQDTLVLFADEVFVTGRRSDEGALKSLITEPTLVIERKGQDVVTARNMVHLIIASNESWVVPAGPFERRFCVLDVAPTHRQDHRYFKALIEEMNGGGREALLYELQHHDLSDVNIRRFPTTKALGDQVMMSMKPGDRWWHERLRDGHVLPTDVEWNREIRRDHLREHFAEWMTIEIGKPGAGSPTALGMLLDRLLPTGYPQETRRSVAGRRERFYLLPTLSECRKAWEQEMGPTDWPEKG